MTEHTPGPWKLASTDYQSFCPVPDCHCFGTGIIQAGSGALVAGTNCNEDRLADARLIAAAPELLAAIQKILAKWGNLHPDDRALLREVVAKAEERS